MAPSNPPRDRAPAHAADSADNGRGHGSGDLDVVWTMTVELIAATLTWGGIGWVADRLLGTAPWLLFAGFLVGNGAGIYLLWQRGAGAGAEH